MVKAMLNRRVVSAALALAPLSAIARAAPAGRYAPVRGLQLYYEIHGTPNGRPPLILLHGGGSSIETSFAQLLPRLARSRQVVAFDQQGHGRTADVERPFSFEQSADDTAALLQHLKIERADLLGFSNGGTIALQVAIRHPKLVRKLIVVSGMYRRDGVPPEFWQGMRQATLPTMPADLRASYQRIAPHPEQLPTFFDKSVRRMLEFKDIPAESLRAIAAPTMIVNGDRDVTRPEHAVEMFRLLPHAQLAILPATDHAIITKSLAEQPTPVESFLDAR
jgi:pimeloyl-ACP methyl ester carboxylesterase